MFCFKCGASLSEGSQACPQCGAELKDAPQPPALPSTQVPGWTQPGMPNPYAFRPPTDGKAIASMVFGILGILCFWGVFGVPAVILGHLAKSSIDRSTGRLKGEGMAMAGLIMGYLSVGLGALFLIGFIAGLSGSGGRANESTAASTVRSLNDAQVKYSTQIDSSRSYAVDLATLGPGPTGVCVGTGTPEHACLIDNILGNVRCKSGTWCFKRNYQYTITGVCGEDHFCTDYVIVATPLSPLMGKKSFCSTSDLIVRSRPGHVTTPLRTVAECQAWSAVE